MAIFADEVLVPFYIESGFSELLCYKAIHRVMHDFYVAYLPRLSPLSTIK